MLWRENQLKSGVSEQESNDPVSNLTPVIVCTACTLLFHANHFLHLFQMWEERHFRSKISYYVNPFEKSASLTRPDPQFPV